MKKTPQQDALNLILKDYHTQTGPQRFKNYQAVSSIAGSISMSWFSDMLEDTERNAFYRSMIDENVKDKVVIDLGSGTGMWCMEALKKGARFVYVIERHPIFAKFLEVTFADHPVKIITKSIYDLTPEDFNEHKPEVLIHELFCRMCLGENVIPIFQKIWEIFPERNLNLIPGGFEMEARVIKNKPFPLENHEDQFLKGKLNYLYEVVYPLSMKTYDVPYNDEQKKVRPLSLLKVALKDIDNGDYSLNNIELKLEPGLIHRIYLTFKIYSDDWKKNFDTCLTDSHWKSQFIEFYVSSDMKELNQQLVIPLLENSSISQPYFQTMDS